MRCRYGFPLGLSALRRLTCHPLSTPCRPRGIRRTSRAVLGASAGAIPFVKCGVGMRAARVP